MRYFRVSFLLVLAVLFCSPSHAEKLNVSFKAEAGDQAVVTLIKTRQIPRYGEIKIIFNYDLNVLKKTKEGYVIRWHPVDMDMTGLPEELVNALGPTLRSSFLPFEYVANHHGLPIRINDKEKTFKMIRNFTTKVLKDSQAPEQSSKLMNKVIKLFEGMDEKSLARLLAKEATLLARNQHVSIDTTKTVVIKDVAPNPFGKGTIDVKTTLNGQRIKPDLVEVKYRVDLTEEEMKSLALSLLKSALGPNAKATMKDVGSINLHVEEYGTAVVNLKDGWTRSLDHVRNITAQGKSRKETIRILVKRK